MENKKQLDIEMELENEIEGNQLQEAENLEVSSETIDDSPDNDTENFYEKRKLLDQTKISKQTWSISEIYQKMIGNKLILDPDYQRNYIWNLEKRTAFIESLFMGIVIPPLYVVEISNSNPLEETRYEIVDGKQRLSTLKNFIDNKLKLSKKSLEYYQDLFADKKFSSIHEEFKDLVSEMLSSVLDIYVITANSPEFIKYDIFSRLNKGSQSLKVNEIRKAIYKSSVIDQVDQYVNENLTNSFYTYIFSQNDIKRFEDYGRFFRSIAFYKQIDIDTKTIKDYNSRPRDMINKVLSKFQDDSYQIEENVISDIINATIELTTKYKNEDNKNSNYLVDLAIYFKVNYPDNFKQKADLIAEDPRIKATFEKSPSTTSMVNKRLEIMTDIILGK